MSDEPVQLRSGVTSTEAREGDAAPVRRRRSRLASQHHVHWMRLVLLAVLLGAWELLSGTVIDTFWVSEPSRIGVYAYDWILHGDFFRHLWVTVLETGVGFAVGASAGLLLGLPLGRADRLARVLDPFLLALNGIPRVALAPLFVIWFGIGILPKIVLVFTLVFFVVFYNAYAGVRSVEKRYVDLAWTMGASGLQLFRKVVFPAALPYILLGLKLSIPYAVIGAIIGEFIASSEGLGYVIQVETSQYNTTGTMTGLLVLMTIVVVLNAGLNRIEAYALRWRPKQGPGGASTEAL